MNRIKIFIDAHVFDDSLQGSRTYLSGLYNELIKINPTVDFYFGAYAVRNLTREVSSRENVHFVKYSSRNKFLRLLFIIPYILLRYKIDIAHYQYISPFIKLSKEIVTIHDVLFLDYPDLFPFGYRLRNKILFWISSKRADYLLTVSDYSRERISYHFKIEKSKIFVIPNGVNSEFFIVKEKLPDVKHQYGLDKYILYVSRIEPRKNHYLLIRAFVELGLWQKDYKLVLVGSRSLNVKSFDDYMNNLKDEIKNSVILIDEAHGELLRSFYRYCTLFIYPSLAEGFGIPPLEAAAEGVPVLCSGLTAMSDFTFFAEQLFDASSLITLKEKITQSLSSYTLDICRTKEYVMEHYNWKRSADSFNTVVFNGIISKE